MNIYLTFSLWDLRFTHSAFNGNSPAVTTKRRTSISSISYSSRGAGTLCRAIYGQHSSWYQTAWELFSHFPGEQTCCMPIRSRRKSENKGKNKKPKLIFQINTRDNFFSESFDFIWCFCPKWLKVIHTYIDGSCGQARCQPALQEQFGVQYLAQGHFHMQTLGIEPRTSNNKALALPLSHSHSLPLRTW